MLIFVFKQIFIATRPICRINTLLDQPMKSRMRPIPHTPDQAVFERIDMNVIHVRAEISIVANQMLPITTLSYSSFAACHANLGTQLCFWQ